MRILIRGATTTTAMEVLVGRRRRRRRRLGEGGLLLEEGDERITRTYSNSKAKGPYLCLYLNLKI